MSEHVEATSLADRSIWRWNIWRWFRDTFSRPPKTPQPPLESLYNHQELKGQVKELAIAAPGQVSLLAEVYARGQRVLLSEDKQEFDTHIGDAVRSVKPHAKKLTKDQTDSLNRNVRFAVAFVRRREGEIARRRYTGGLLTGILISILVLFAIWGAAWLLWQLLHVFKEGDTGKFGDAPITEGHPRGALDVLIAFAGGAVGATLSLILRLRRTPLTVESVNSGAAFVRIALG